MRLHNSLTKKLEEFKPIKTDRVGLYTCGPTVYDHVHIGNLRTYIFEDTLRRVLKLSGYQVSHVMNITDIEDKIFARTKESGRDFKELTKHYEQHFHEDTEQVGIDLVNSKLIRATEAINDMQRLIKKIPNKYIADDGIYFDIAKYPDYGVFVNLDRSHTHHRINNDEYDKEHVADFALWKAKRPGEPSWDFEIDGQNIEGRPGWHIECSAMSTKFLGQPFDIHTGGVDLKFPHHENEIAQSRTASGQQLANVFLHGEYLLVDGKKMSKSLKNFYILDDIAKKGFDPLAFRLLVLQAHYRSQLNFTWESLTAAQTFLQTAQAMADRQFQPTSQKTSVNLKEWFMKGKTNTVIFLEDDLNTPRAVAWLAELIDFIETTPLNKSEMPAFRDFLKFLDDAFGLQLIGRKDINSAQKGLLRERETARDNKDYAKADKIRTGLKKQGIGVNDSAYGATWYRI